MVDIINAAYYGNTGTLVVDSDTHFGVNSFALVPTTADELIEDISGEVQGITGTPMWRAQIEFNQDWVTAGSLSQESIAWTGTEKVIAYTPQEGAEVATVTVTFKPSQVGGNTARRTATLDLPVTGQPVFAPAP